MFRWPRSHAPRVERAFERVAGPAAKAEITNGFLMLVVGGGNSAGQAALFLARNASDVNLVIRHDDLNRDMSRYVAERIVSAPRVHVWRSCEVCELLGDLGLEEVIVHDLRTDERRPLSATALFLLIGSEPRTRWLRARSRSTTGGGSC
jgi:thioredoxin reductase (NADPH)